MSAWRSPVRGFEHWRHQRSRSTPSAVRGCSRYYANLVPAAGSRGVVGGGIGWKGEWRLSPVIQLAQKYPNISGIYLDDFIVDVKQPSGVYAGRPAIQPAELKRAAERLKTAWAGRAGHLDHALHPRDRPPRTTSPGYRGCEPPGEVPRGARPVQVARQWIADARSQTLEQQWPAGRWSAAGGATAVLHSVRAENSILVPAMQRPPQTAGENGVNSVLRE